jgi:hypothetical protein
VVYLATLEGRQTDSDQDYNFVSNDGSIYTKTTLGSYYPVGHISDYGLHSTNQLHGIEDAVELFGDELGKGFKFKMPKMKFKAPKFKMPKMKFKAPKFKAPKFKAPNFKMPNFKMPDLGKLGEGLLDAGMGLMSPGGGMGEGHEEPQEEIQDEQMQQDEMQSFDDSSDEMSGYTVGCKIDSTGKAYRFSPIDQKLVELSGEELGYAQFLPMAMQAGQSLMASQQKTRAQKQAKNNQRNQMLQKLLMSKGNSIQDKFGNFARGQVQQRLNPRQQRRPVRKIGNKIVRFDQSANLQKELAQYTNQLQNFQTAQARPVQSSFTNTQPQTRVTQPRVRSVQPEPTETPKEEIETKLIEPPVREKKDNSTMLIVGAVVLGGGYLLMNSKG